MVYNSPVTSIIDSPGIIHLLHPLLLNTKIYYTQGGNIPRGRRPSGIFATEGVINLVFNIVEGALTVLLFT